MLSWFFQRITGAFLVIGMVVHFWVLHFGIERPLNFQKVIDRLATPGWILFDIILLATAVYHGLNGIWQIYLDVNPEAKQKNVVGWLIVLLGVTTFAYGCKVLADFMLV